VTVRAVVLSDRRKLLAPNTLFRRVRAWPHQLTFVTVWDQSSVEVSGPLQAGWGDRI